jgi:hypothetical protein
VKLERKPGAWSFFKVMLFFPIHLEQHDPIASQDDDRAEVPVSTDISSKPLRSISAATVKSDLALF